MLKKTKAAVCLGLAASILSSCATVFGGHVNAYQRTKPKDGEQTRRIRPVALVADIVLFPLGLVVDFATCAIYKPTPLVDSDTPLAAPTPVAVKTK